MTVGRESVQNPKILRLQKFFGISVVGLNFPTSIANEYKMSPEFLSKSLSVTQKLFKCTIPSIT